MSLTRSYAEFFQDSSRSPLSTGRERVEVVKRLYHWWRTTGTPATSQELFSIVLDQFESKAPGGLGVFVTGVDGLHRLQVIHGMRKYPGRLAYASALDKRTFAYHGDVNRRGVASIVEVTSALMEITPEVVVYNLENHKSVLTDDPERDVIRTLQETEDNTETVRTRHSMYIPFDLMPVLLDKDYTARQAFLAVEEALTDPDLKQACQPLLSFLRVGGTLSTGDVVLTAQARICEPFVLEAALDEYMFDRVIQRDLPYFLQDRIEGTTNNMATMQATLQALANREADKASGQSETKSATIAEVFGEHNTLQLLGLCHKDNTDELPPIYTNLASRCRNTSELTIVQTAFDQSRIALGLPGRAIATPAVMQFVKQFQFHGINDTDVASGVLPMSFVPPGAGSKRGQDRLTEDLYQQFGFQTMMSTDSQLLTSNDAMALIKSKGFIPLKWAEADGQLETYQAVLHSLFGPAHPLFLAYRTGWRYYRRIYIRLQNSLDETVGALGPALLVFLFQSIKSGTGWPDSGKNMIPPCQPLTSSIVCGKTSSKAETWPGCLMYPTFLDYGSIES